jgi:predicted phosphoribosyltransferase
LPVGRAVADAFDVRLDIVAAKKLGAPGNPELAIGAAAADGSVWLNDRILGGRAIDESYLESEREAAMRTAEEKEETYRGGRDPPELAGKHVAIVDDGVATGATMRACIQAVRNAGAATVIVGIPVGPRDTVAELREMADTVVVVDQPRFFRAVGGHYVEFGQVTDEEAMAYLQY